MFFAINLVAVSALQCKIGVLTFKPLVFLIRAIRKIRIPKSFFLISILHPKAHASEIFSPF
jgi:hypothetical protein